MPTDQQNTGEAAQGNEQDVPHRDRGGRNEHLADEPHHHGSVRLVKARPLSAAGVSPPVQIITPSLS